MAASSKATDIVLKPCEIESCQRISATLCHHCRKHVCRRHFNEHANQLVQELHPLADGINKLREKVSTFRVQEYKQKEIDKLNRWRDEAIQNINDLYEWKKRKLDLLIQHNEEVFLQQTTSHLATVNKMTEVTAIFIEEDDVTFGQLQMLKRQLHALEDRVTETHTRLVYCDIKPVPIDYTWLLLHSSANNYMRGGTLLCADYQMKLNEFYGKAKQKWELIYKATKDGFRAEDFHRCSDNKGPTMTIIQSQNGNYLFGGYTELPWDRDNKYKRDPAAFLFTLINPHGIQPTKFLKNVDNNMSSVGHAKNKGPHFGGTIRDGKHFCDFSISGDYLIRESTNCVSDFPTAFIDTTGRGETLFTGTRTFMVAEIEVYKREDGDDDGDESDGEKEHEDDDGNEGESNDKDGDGV